MSLDLRSQFKSLLEPKLMDGFIDQTISFKIIRFRPGKYFPETSSITFLSLDPSLSNNSKSYFYAKDSFHFLSNFIKFKQISIASLYSSN